MNRSMWDSAVLLAIVTAVVYTAGRTYLDSYYGQFGLHEGQLDFPVPYVMKQSILPLLIPVFFLGSVAELARRARAGSADAPAYTPFHPIPTAEVLNLILWAWAFKLLWDFRYPSSVQWLFWNRRDLIFFVLGFIILLQRLWHHRRKEQQQAHLLQPPTASLVSVLVVGMAFVIADSISRGQWSLPWISTFIVLIALTYTVFVAVRDIRTWKARKEEQASQAPETALPRPPVKPGMNIYLLVVAAVALLLAASLQGVVEGQEAIRGCKHFKSITFDPAPPGTVANKTYWMVLYNQGVYYVRDPPTGNATVTLAIPADSGFSAATMNAPAPNPC